jgi:nucleotide-binding universal stress UspA family protein
MFGRILVPLDGSDEAASAVPFAAELARRFGSTILLLEMVRTTGTTLALAADAASGAMTDPHVIATEAEAREQAAEGYVSAVAEQLAGQGLDVSYTVGEGREGAGIADAAKREKVDLIVMATHARGTLGRLVFGSVTDDVVRHTTIPVLAVPPKRDGE